MDVALPLTFPASYKTVMAHYVRVARSFRLKSLTLYSERRQLSDRIAALENQARIDRALIADMSLQLKKADQCVEWSMQEAGEHHAEERSLRDSLIRVREQLANIIIETTQLVDLT